MSEKNWRDINFTDPQNHDSRQFIYLIHAIQTNDMVRTMQNLTRINLGSSEKTIDLSKKPEDISKKKIISCSLIGKGKIEGKDFEQLETWSNVRINFKSTTRKYFTFWNY